MNGLPLVSIAIELPNGLKETLYYPSEVVLNYLEEKEYSIEEFIKLASDSLDASQQRVIQKLGYQCLGCFFIKDKLSIWSRDLDQKSIISITKITIY